MLTLTDDDQNVASNASRSHAMVHPSQQRPPILPRRQACLTLMRGGKARVYRIRPWAAGLALSVSAILLTA
jgi:hypothetical protein